MMSDFVHLESKPYTKSIRDKLSDLDNEISFSERKHAFFKMQSDRAFCVCEHAATLFEKADVNTRKAERRLRFVRLKCGFIRLILNLRSKL